MADQNILNGTITTTQVITSSTATLLPATRAVNRQTWIAYNDGSAPLYLGGSGVTTSTGIPVGTGAYSPSIDLGNAQIYGITTGAGTVRVMEIS
jgi:hypothetical protein